MDIQRATSLDQYAIADSYAPSNAARDAVSVREPGPEPDLEQAAPEPAEEPAASAAPALPGVYARNARQVAVRMATPSISLLA